MRKLFLLALAVGFVLPLSAQKLQFGVKGGLNINTSDFSFYNKTENNAFVNSLKNKAGYHVGGFLRLKLPVPAVGLYLQPEVLYTRNAFRYEVIDEVAGKTNLKIKENLVSVPVMVGMKFAFLRLYLGPKFCFNVGDDVSKSTENTAQIETDFKDKVFGYQVGAGVDIFKKVTLDLSYNGFFKRSRQVVTVDGTDIGGRMANKQIWISLGYIF